ncbi:hypothetical protein GCM10011428_39180 [Streptomyces violaceus]
MTDHEHAATGPGPGSGPRPAPGAGPRDAAPAGSPAQGRADAGEQGGAHDAADPAGEAAPPRAFRRDRRHKTLAGVCAGLGRQCDMDPVIFRITLAVLSVTGGIGLLFYGFVWLLVPYDDEDENEVRKLLTGRVDGQALTAVLFALVGCGVFLTLLNNGGVLTFAFVLSILLAGSGYWSRQRGAPAPTRWPPRPPPTPRPNPRRRRSLPPPPPGGATPSSRTAPTSAARATCGAPARPATRTSRQPSTSGSAPGPAAARTYPSRAAGRPRRADPAGSAAGSSCWPCSPVPWAPT